MKAACQENSIPRKKAVWCLIGQMPGFIEEYREAEDDMKLILFRLIIINL